MAIKEMTLREFIREVDADVDFYSDTTDRAGICLVAGVKLTKAGRAHFKRALDAHVVYMPDAHEAQVICGEDWRQVERDVFGFLMAAAGYVGDRDYVKWFEEEVR